MERELVEKITKLVLERLGVEEFSTIKPLSAGEIKEWESFHRDKLVYENCCNSNYKYTVPLSETELNEWVKISEGNPYKSEFNSCNGMVTKKVKFSKYI
ncbi:hypothetical protein [Calidifontibacillus erzurumensis]|uniref:Uncharacterized protein n=1 Tax=Calidifontibacillus erzurumensis TaxID=2741433 RepID=A0A8J8GEZ8_9BACI|nr:hypothetical protein [Calidifontibacillus erzurumensis]NSL51050.1 hypothetical protein [Calidifontibacillus erzurumensis]